MGSSFKVMWKEYTRTGLNSHEANLDTLAAAVTYHNDLSTRAHVKELKLEVTYRVLPAAEPTSSAAGGGTGPAPSSSPG